MDGFTSDPAAGVVVGGEAGAGVVVVVLEVVAGAAGEAPGAGAVPKVGAAGGVALGSTTAPLEDVGAVGVAGAAGGTARRGGSMGLWAKAMADAVARLPRVRLKARDI